MTKKHFIALADMIRHRALMGDPFSDSQKLALANFCCGQNPNFNSQRWLDYIAGKCGKNGGAIKSPKNGGGNPSREEWLKMSDDERALAGLY